MTGVGVALTRALAARGIDTVFGIPGVHTLELYRGLAESAIRHVTARHEQGAGFMADGYARVSGRPGVAFVITGPGVTNILTPMAQARADSVPMLVVSSVNGRPTLGRGLGHLHELPDQHALAAQVALLSEHVEQPEALSPALSRVFDRLGGGRGGPVHLQVPTDVLTLPVPEGVEAAPPPPRRVAGDPATLTQAARMLGQARRPVILAGGGARHADAALRTLAARCDAPVVLTANARGLMHGAALAVPASPSLSAVRTLIAQSDCVLAAGTEFGPTDYDMYETGALPAPADMIRIDICPEQLARRAAALTIEADAAPALEALTAQLPDASGAHDGAARAAAARHAALDEIGPDMRADIVLLNAIRDTLPGALIVGDSTQLVYSGNLAYDHDRPGGWFNAATGYGALGYAPGAAIGAALADPQAPVICLIGDGGLMFSAGELMTAMDEALPITFLVWNNHGFGEIAAAMRAAGTPVLGCDPTPPVMHDLARSCGMPFQRVRAEAGALSAALRLPPDGPRMIEVAPGTP